MKSEERCEGRLHLKSLDLEDCVQLWVWMEQRILKDSAFKVFSFLLQIFVCKDEDEQIKVCLDAMPDIFHFDATSAMCRTPNCLKCKIIFYSAMLWRGRDSIIPIFEMFTSEHDSTSIEIAIKRFKAFVFKFTNRWPIIKAVVVDWSWVFIKSLNFE